MVKWNLTMIKYPANISTSVQRCFLVDITSRRRKCQINVETTLKFTTLSNVETTLCFSTLNWTTLGNVEITLSFSTSIFTTLGNVETTLRIWPFEKKIKPRLKNKIIFLSFKEYAGFKNFLHYLPILRGSCKRTFGEPQIFLKHRIYRITKSIFKPSYFVKCQLVFNF